MNNRISIVSKLLLLLSAICLLVSIFVPIWRIELDAPQYPEGLVLQIYADSLGGDVQIINGLNHYIGMRTLHEDDFIEFTVLPYIIGAFALAALITLLIARKRGLYILFTSFVIFGIVAMVDFWRWEYEYGHNLDPHAAIIVPGMAYQPPLIGFKQLLNFGAFSIPDKGGWLFIISGILMLVAVIIEFRSGKKGAVQRNSVYPAMLAAIIFTSCSPPGPEPVKLNIDQCDNCMMTISDIRFAGELITDKGRIYKFDDVLCMKQFVNAKEYKYQSVLVCEYNAPNTLTEISELYFVKSQALRSPMAGNIAAFKNKEVAEKNATELNGEMIRWENIEL